MSRHAYTVVFFPTLEDLVAAFEDQARYAERDLGYEPAGPDTDVTVPGWSVVGAELREHAAATAGTVAQQWASLEDPRDPAGAEVAELVAHTWRSVAAYAAEESAGDSSSVCVAHWLPDAVEERPLAIPRAAGVRYFRAAAFTSQATVPPGSAFAVAVRDDVVDDRDWEHIIGTADPGQP